MRQDDAIRLRHMLDAALEAVAFAQGRNRSDLDTNYLPDMLLAAQDAISFAL
jgi:hypothetical protein